jgi:aspartate carbamoyltransferase catalytic subunit
MLPFRSLISADQIDSSTLRELFRVTDEMALLVSERGRADLLADKVVALLFFEPSSRTMLSFQAAAQRLRAGVILAQGAEGTSLNKGESIEDTLRVVSSYADLVVMRHSRPGSAAAGASFSSVPFINAGDGKNEHPTQALIDAYTILKEVGRIQDLKVTFGFDPRQSRSIHSLAALLSGFPNNHFTFVSPKELEPSPELLARLEGRGASCRVTQSLAAGLDADVLYMNRLQEERFPDRGMFERYRREYTLTRAIVADRRFAILDPLPRIDEISPEVDALPQAAYFRQAAFGVPVRMALLAMFFGRERRVAPATEERALP